MRMAPGCFVGSSRSVGVAIAASATNFSTYVLPQIPQHGKEARSPEHHLEHPEQNQINVLRVCELFHLLDGKVHEQPKREEEAIDQERNDPRSRRLMLFTAYGCAFGNWPGFRPAPGGPANAWA